MRRGSKYSDYMSAVSIDAGPTLDVLCAACAECFLPPAFAVRRDDGSGTVWVSRNGEGLSIGLRPNTVARRGLAEVLAETGARLAGSQPQTRSVEIHYPV